MAAPDTGIIHATFDERATVVCVDGVAEHCHGELRIRVGVAIEYQVSSPSVEPHPLHWGNRRPVVRSNVNYPVKRAEHRYNFGCTG
jgi:hypothetical protein